MPVDHANHAPSPPPAGFALRLLNLVYGLVLLFIIVFLFLPIFVPLLVVVLVFFRGMLLSDAIRMSNVMFGDLCVTLARPFVQVEEVGFDRVPHGRSCVYVANHRSFIDVFLMSQLGVRRVNIAVRSWPFGIPLMGWFMRLGRYMEMEADRIEEVLKDCARDSQRGLSFLFFPEGHRSRDGRVQRFRSGAFLIADACDLPVVVTCIQGSEKVAPIGRLMIAPGCVRIEILGIIEPDRFAGPKRALRLRREAERMIREHLGEMPENDAVFGGDEEGEDDSAT